MTDLPCDVEPQSVPGAAVVNYQYDVPVKRADRTIYLLGFKLSVARDTNMKNELSVRVRTYWQQVSNISLDFSAAEARLVGEALVAQADAIEGRGP